MATRRDHWRVHVTRWTKSGLRAEEYGTKHGVNPRTLVYWKWRLGKEEAKAERGHAPKRARVRSQFIEVRAGVQDRFELELQGGRRLIVPTTFDADALSRLIGTLERRA